MQDTYSQSDDPCSELYHGHVAGSELEVQVLTAYIKSLGRVVGAIDFHSYHQKILYPPGESCIYKYICVCMCGSWCTSLECMHVLNCVTATGDSINTLKS